MTVAPVVGLVAGEVSGDLLGAHLAEALKTRRPDLQFAGIAGPRMIAAGVEALFPMEKLAVRGYVEVLKHYMEIVSIRRRLKQHFLAQPPAVFIGIDAPDFNLDLELALKRAGIPTVHYVSPSIWAWRGDRIHTIKQAVDRILALFPFETNIYEKAGVPVSYVGHPLADMLHGFPSKADVRSRLASGTTNFTSGMAVAMRRAVSANNRAMLCNSLTRLPGSRVTTAPAGARPSRERTSAFDGKPCSMSASGCPT